MRLAPIERPKSLLLRFGYWLSRRQLGTVIASMKIIYARSPRIARTGFSIVRTMETLSLDPELRLLIPTQSAMLNGCSYCGDLHRAQAVQAKIGLEKFRHLTDVANGPDFDARQRAALLYTAAVTERKPVPDAMFEELRRHFSEQEIVEITWLNAIGNFFNLMAVPLQIESDGLTEVALRKAS